MKHVLLAQAVDVLPHSDPDDFAGRPSRWIRNLDPGTETESELVRRAATLSWKLDRADRYEYEILTRLVLDAVDACDSDETSLLIEAANSASFDPSMGGEMLRRDQLAILREMHKTVESLTKLKTRGSSRRNVSAPNKPIFGDQLSAPNKPIFGDQFSAPNKPICRARGTTGGLGALEGRWIGTNLGNADISRDRPDVRV